MQTIECIKDRRSVREYKPVPVPDGVLEEVLEAAVQAPSSGNVQDWEFIIVKSPETKKSLVEAAWGQDFIAEAPVVLVVCSDGSRGENLYSIQNTSAAIQNLLLTAWDRGIGSCWIGAFNEKAVRDMLVLPTSVRPMAIITLGYPARVSKKPKRKDVKEVTHTERWE
jgi:nitroreductase